MDPKVKFEAHKDHHLIVLTFYINPPMMENRVRTDKNGIFFDDVQSFVPYFASKRTGQIEMTKDKN